MVKAIEHVGLEGPEAATHRDHVVHVELLLPNRHHVVLEQRGFEHRHHFRVHPRTREIDAGDLRAESLIQRFDSHLLSFHGHSGSRDGASKNCIASQPNPAGTRRPPCGKSSARQRLEDGSRCLGMSAARCI